MRRFLPFFIFSLIFCSILPPARAFSREHQEGWLVLGGPQDTAESRLSSGGTLRPFAGSFEIVPLIESGPDWLTAASAEHEISYKENHLPLPSVIWHFQDYRFEIEALAWGKPERSHLWARYRLINKAPRTVKGKVHFLLRPSSSSSIHSIEFSEAAKSIRVNGAQMLYLSKKSAEAGFLKLSQGSVTEKIIRHDIPQIHSVKDLEGGASGVWSYPFRLKESGQIVFEIKIPLHPERELEKETFDRAMLAARSYWREKLKNTGIQIADSEFLDSTYLQIASLFILRDHPGFYPESKAPGRVWTGNTLKAVQTYLDYGFFQEAREDLEIAALHAGSGKLLAGMEKEADPVKEYGLQGKWISSILNYYKVSKDKTWLNAKWPFVKEVLEYLKRLRMQRLTEWYASGSPDRKRFYGILPPSADPVRGDFELVHRYEDDLLAVKAFKDGQKMAAELGFPNDAEWMKSEEWALRRALLDSIALTSSLENIRFIPPSPEKAVMTPWPGVTAVWPAEEAFYFPLSRMDDHFRNIKEIFEKSKITRPEKADLFSSFEVIRAFLRRGEKTTAHEMFRFQYDRLDGDDISKTAGFLQAVRDFFVYEASGKLILGAGVLPAWTESETGLQAEFPTSYGGIKYSVRPIKNGWHVHAEGTAHPPEGFIFHAPSGKARQAFRRLPVDFEIQP